MTPERTDIKEEVRRRYAACAGAQPTACCGPDPSDTVSSNLYTRDELQGLPAGAVRASLGCGNPVAVADLREGETVLDLGSGGGIDVLLSARRVGPFGKAYGLDMTDEMVALARENARKAGVANVEFLKGEIEDVPLPDASVDVIISNCVVNLSPDKDRVLREAHRVLKPGGRLAIADIVTRGDLPEELRRDLELWTGCIAGALDEDNYRRRLQVAGFEEIEIEPLREYTAAEASGLSETARQLLHSAADDVAILSALIRARKPGADERRSVPITPVRAERRISDCC